MAENRVQQEPPRFDPFEAWREFYEASEQAWTKSIREMTTTPDYVEIQGRVLETFLAYQKLLRDAMTSQLNFFNLPTRDDIGRLGELLVGVEEKVDRLDETVAKLQQTVSALDEQLGQAEAPIAGVEQKVDGLDQAIAKLDKYVRDLSRQLSGLVRPIDGVEGKVNHLGERVSKLDESLLAVSQQLSRLERHATSTTPASERDESTAGAGEPSPERSRRSATGRAGRQISSAGEGKK